MYMSEKHVPFFLPTILIFNKFCQNHNLVVFGQIVLNFANKLSNTHGPFNGGSGCNMGKFWHILSLFVLIGLSLPNKACISVTWLFLVRLWPNFLYSFLTYLDYLRIQFGKIFVYLGTFLANCSQILHMGYPNHTDNSAHRRQLTCAYKFRTLTSWLRQTG